MISTDIFLQIADRMAAQYGALVTAVAAMAPVATKATLATGLVGSNNAITWTAVTAGSDGNLISITIVNPGTANQPLSLTLTGTSLVVSLATNSGSAITTTATLLLAAVLADCSLTGLLTAISTTGSSGAGTLTALAQTNLAGGLHGLYDPIVVGSADQNLILAASSSAINLDTLLTADVLVQDAGLWTSMLGSLRSYFATVQQSNLIDGFCTANSIQVHQYFDQINYLTIGTHLLSANVFIPTVQSLGTITMAGTGHASLTLNPTGSKAFVVMDPGVANTALTWTAVTAGIGGNAISVTYVNPGTPSQPLYVEVEGYALIVHLATDGSSNLSTTAAQIITAVAASTAASALVVATNFGGSSGAGVVTAMAVVYLTNTGTSIVWTALTAGPTGNLISITYVVAGNNTSLTISVTGYAITVNVATDASGNPTSTPILVAAAVQAYAPASLLVTASGTGASYVSAVSATYLFGGGVPVLSALNPLGTGLGVAGPGNYAAQKFQVTVTPNVSFASLLLYPINAKAAATITPVSGTNNAIVWTAVTGGVAGNSISITYQWLQIPSTSLSVSVTANAITVTLATSAASVPTSTAAAVIAAVAAYTPASTLVLGTNAGGSSGAGVIPEPVGPVFLTNTNTKILYTAVASGTGGNAITVAYVVAGTNTSLTVGVVSNAITVNVATDGSGNPTSTASLIVAAVIASGSAAALVTPSIPTGGSGAGIVAAVSTTSLTVGDGPNSVRATTLGLTLLRSDLSSVVRNLVVNAATTPGTVIPIGAQSATLTTGSGNNSVLLTAVASGTGGNSITVSYVGPGVPGSALSTTVVGSAITVSLATTPSGVIYSTANDVVASINGAASSLVTASLPTTTYGWQPVVAQAATALSGGVAAENFYGITNASVVVGGEPGDVYVLSQIPERTITL